MPQLPLGITRTEDLPGLRELWAHTTGIPEVCIAVLDGAVDICHPCFRGANLQLADPLGLARANDFFVKRHGTGVASVLFGRHDTAVKGVAPCCRGLIIPIYHTDSRSRSLKCSQADLALAIREAVRLGADVINVSGGELAPKGAPSRELADAVQYCASKGRLLVAAAGNDGCAECLHVPGALPSVLTVGATEPDGKPLAQSNWGGAYQAQGIVAPGRNVVVASPGDGYAAATGTSLATPLVSGVAALLASLQRRYVRQVDYSMVRSILLAAATGCDEQPTDHCERLLVGRLNIARAHSYLLRALKGSAMTGPGEPVIETAVPPVTPVPTTPELSAAVPAAFVAPAVLPADCGCGGNSSPQYVYVIGDRIRYDFGSRVRQLSLQNNDVHTSRALLTEPAAFIRYLLGYGPPGDPNGAHRANGNLHDAKAVHWVLYQENCPRYAIEPHDCFCEALYKALITFFIETHFDRDPSTGSFPLFSDDKLGNIRYDCLSEYFDCFGGMQDPLVGTKQVRPGGRGRSAEQKRKAEGGQPAEEGRPTEEGQPAEEGKPAAAGWLAADKDLRADIGFILGEQLTRSSKVAIAGTWRTNVLRWPTHSRSR